MLAASVHVGNDHLRIGKLQRLVSLASAPISLGKNTQVMSFLTHYVIYIYFIYTKTLAWMTQEALNYVIGNLQLKAARMA